MKVCAKCGIEKPLDAFHILRDGRLGRRPQCRVCRCAEERERYRLTPLNVRQKRKKPWGSVPSQRYGLSEEEYAELLQQTTCAICGRDEVVLVIDHDHLTGAVRGRLCVRCNTGLGKFLDNPDMLRRAVCYLEGTRLDEELARNASAP